MVTHYFSSKEVFKLVQKKYHKTETLKRIKLLRENLDYTQEQFSEFIGVPYSTYTKMETGFQNITLSKMIVISEKLNVTIDYLIYGKSSCNDHQLELLKTLLESADKEKLKYARDFLNVLANLE